LPGLCLAGIHRSDSAEIPKPSVSEYNIGMVISRLRRLLPLFAFGSVLLTSLFAFGQDDEKRGRKYVPPPPTAHVSVAVVKDTNGKPVENAAVVFHLVGDRDKGNMEMKTNEEGKAVIDVIAIGDTVRLQIIADGFQTYGEDYKIDSDSKNIVVRLKRPARQYSTYEHANGGSAGTQASSSNQTSSPKSSDSQTAPKQ
jgi:hypothetical protein